jgi:hypothetical protein
MEKFNVQMIRTYTTEFNIEADNYPEALEKFKAMGDTIYTEELEQCNVDEQITIYGKKWPRKCTTCQNGMSEGYYALGDYYCSDECLHKDYIPEDWVELSKPEEDDNGYYWTEWEDTEDLQFQEINGIVTEIE